MKTRIIAAIALSLALTGAAQAQFTASIKTNIINNGVVSNWVGNGTYVVGSNTFKDVLQVINSGVLSDGTGYLGYETSGSNNVVTVTGPGSVWNNNNSDISLYVGYSGSGNTLTITNGGTVYSYYSYIGESAGANSNVVTVTGNGSIWYNNQAGSGELHVGDSGSGNTLTIINGGAVINIEGYIGELAGGNSNAVTVTGAGSVWNNSSWLLVGTRGYGNRLTITNEGAVYSFGSLIGGLASASNNAVTVTGAGSVWSNSNGRINGLLVGYDGSGNKLTIINGGAVINLEGYVGGYIGGGDSNLGSVLSANTTPANSNAVIVTGAGSVWNNSTNLTVGYYGYGNTLTITNNGTVYNADAYIGYTNGANNNAMLVTGTGSVLNNSGNLLVGVSGSTNSLTVANNGSVIASNVYVGFYSSSVGNQIAISGGSLYGTNSAGTGALNVRHGTLNVNGGTITVDILLLTNTTSGVMVFNSGTINTKSTSVTNGLAFVIGDGASAANFHLLGGVHSFNNGLRVRNNAVLSGCGTINGVVVVDAGGTVLADCSPLVFGQSVTNNGTMRAINGSVLEAYGALVNNGTIDLINGSTNFHGVFINNGTVLDASSVKISQASKSGQDFVVQILSVTGHTYQLQFTPSLTPTNWTNTGTSQSGTGGVLTFTDTGGATNVPARFYRMDVTAP